MKRKLLNGLLIALLLLSGCGNGSTSYSSATTESSTTTRLSELFSNRDLGPSYDEANSPMIALTGNSVSADSGNNRSGTTGPGQDMFAVTEGTYIAPSAAAPSPSQTAKATASPATTPPKPTIVSSSAAQTSAKATPTPSATAARPSPWTASPTAQTPALAAVLAVTAAPCQTANRHNKQKARQIRSICRAFLC